MMNMQKRKTVTIGALLHDVGKLIQRSATSEYTGTHSQIGANTLKDLLSSYEDGQAILDCIKYHHAQVLNHSGLIDDSLAWIVAEADNIAAGVDRRNINEEASNNASGFNRRAVLDSVFNLVQTTKRTSLGRISYALQDSSSMENSVFEPKVNNDNKMASTDSDYAAIWTKFWQGLKAIDLSQASSPNSLANLFASTCQYIPSSTNTNEVSDISLYDHSVLTAAVAACMLEYFEENKISNYKQMCVNEVKKLRATPMFLLVRSDLSGIQDFIYTVSSKQALKSMRGRSLFLNILLEHIADEVLSTLGLSRANLLYNGGGGFYMLLPNTTEAAEALETAKTRVNRWLFDHFSTSLFLGLAWTAASADDFMEKTDGKQALASTASVFSKVSHLLSTQKLSRYSESHDLLFDVFSPIQPKDTERECRICGRSSELNPGKEAEASQAICKNCEAFIRLGKEIVPVTGHEESRRAFCVTNPKLLNGRMPVDYSLRLALPIINKESKERSDVWLEIIPEEELLKLLEKEPAYLRRVYSINHSASGLNVSTQIMVGNYTHCAGITSGTVELGDFVNNDDASGIKRLAVLRADVDNLGELFTSGFNDTAYGTLGRYATLSRVMSVFFGLQINQIAKRGSRNMAIVYSGGDDVFAVGAWQDIIDFAMDLRGAFENFTSGKLSFSAGIGLYRPGKPIIQMAELAGELESEAKRGQKDQIALFGLNPVSGNDKNDRISISQCEHVYKWQEFVDDVLPKSEFLKKNIYSKDRSASLDAGSSFMYKLLALIREANKAGTEGKLSIARLAYLLARREPGSDSSTEDKKNFTEFKSTIYEWSKCPKHRKALETAIILAVYTNRTYQEE